VLQPELSEPNIFTLREPDVTTRTVMVLPLRLAAGSAALCLTEPLALVVVRGPNVPRTPRELLRILHRLTGAEADLISHIAAGSSVADAAERLGISRTTARNQLAAAMAKMGVHRQGELVSVVAALVPRLRLARD